MTRDPDPSPCVGVCVLDEASGLCRGCLRTGEEIGAWRDATRQQRREILHRIQRRRSRKETVSTEPPIKRGSVG